MVQSRLLALRRVGVCGSSRGLPVDANALCEVLGKELASQPNVIIVSGGTRKQEGSLDDDLAVEWRVVNAAQGALPTEDVSTRIETVVTDTKGRWEQFHIGTIRNPRGKTNEARRFSFVRDLDALIAVSGRRGTAQELALAHELGIPVLPVPIFEGAAKEFWYAYRSDLLRELRLDTGIATKWEATDTADLNAIEKFGSEIIATLLGSLPRRCFVIMPFGDDFAALYDFVIEPVVKAIGDKPVRLDRTGFHGDASRHIHDGIRASDYVVAVLDGLRPNVLYELGFAHGSNKPAFILSHTGSLDETRIPFDISVYQRLKYDVLDAQIIDRLKDALLTLPMRRRL
jgi:predicted Rossmann-fold nucleotide-binding protein